MLENNLETMIEDTLSGKAGVGEARKKYLGRHYDLVQKIINERIKKSYDSFKLYTTLGALFIILAIIFLITYILIDYNVVSLILTSSSCIMAFIFTFKSSRASKRLIRGLECETN